MSNHIRGMKKRGNPGSYLAVFLARYVKLPLNWSRIIFFFRADKEISFLLDRDDPTQTGIISSRTEWATPFETLYFQPIQQLLPSGFHEET